MQQVNERELGQIPLRYWQPEPGRRTELLNKIMESLILIDDNRIEIVADEILKAIED